MSTSLKFFDLVAERLSETKVTASRADTESWRNPPPRGLGGNKAVTTISAWQDDRRDTREYTAFGNEDYFTIAVPLSTNLINLTVNGKSLFRGINIEANVNINAPGHRTVLEVEGPLRSVHVHIPRDLIAQIYTTRGGSGDPDKVQLVDRWKHDEVLGQISKVFLHAGKNITSLTQLYLDSALMCFISRLIEFHSNRNGKSGAILPALTTYRFKKVIEYIDSNCSSNIKLRDLAELADLSPSYFASQFKHLSGLRPHEYILRTRVLKAQNLLVHTNDPLSEIALTMGFANQSHLSTVFKRYTGQSPTSWRRGSKSTLAHSTY